jgi:peptidoglycan/LPS O-acetylase OafA/YrhL
LRLAAFFLVGSLCYINRDRVPANGWLFLGTAAAAWLCRPTPVYPYAFALAEITFAFWFAYRSRWYGFNRFGDYSYGIYLWGFPMQQVVAGRMPASSPRLYAACSLPLATAMAALSWHLVEKPAIALKPLPARLWSRMTATRAKPGAQPAA